MAGVALVIKGGTLADGRGGALFEADIAVDDGRIVAIGANVGAGRQEIDARGRLVTPGFVDVHTHYDAQATWSSHLTPSSNNGVTTILMGNCGVGFAPVHAHHHDMLIELMEGVEDIPEVVLSEGLSWNWRSFPDYLDALAKPVLALYCNRGRPELGAEPAFRMLVLQFSGRYFGSRDGAVHA